MKYLAHACLLGVVVGFAPSAAVAEATQSSVFLEDMTTNEVRARLEIGCPVGIMFNAGVEETGPAVALGKHIFRASAYGEAIAHEIGDAIVAPIQPFAPMKETMARKVHLRPLRERSRSRRLFSRW